MCTGPTVGEHGADANETTVRVATLRYVLRQLAGRVPAEHMAKIEAHATENDRTLAAELRRMVRLYVTMLDKRAEGIVSTEDDPAGSSVGRSARA